MKSFGKALLLTLLTWQLRRLYRQNTFKTIAVVGSYGKTSTKFAIATVLKKHLQVQYQAGNYNDLLSVPLIFFGETLPTLTNILTWIRLLIRNERQLRRTYPYDVVVVELGVDGPGQMAQFARYLHVDLAVVTSIAPEHMEYFADLQAVANEELVVAEFSDTMLMNNDLCDKTYRARITKPTISYAADEPANYQVKATHQSRQCSIYKDHKQWVASIRPGPSKSQRYSACAAAAVGDQLGMPSNAIALGIADIVPPSGRMQWLRGIRSSTILDETYNASPDAVKAALDVLYDLEAPQKIALLGNMNELGAYSERSHQEIGSYCDPAELDLVLTLGPHANQFLADAARERGCRVITCTSPYEAGEYLKQHIRSNSAILVKGSQNGVFAEEAIKMILANPEDSQLLVRQSTHWLKVKKKAWNHGPRTPQTNSTSTD